MLEPLIQDELGVEFIRNPLAASDHDVVVVDIDKLYESLRERMGDFAGPGGGGRIGNRIQGVKDFLIEARDKGTQVRMPILGTRRVGGRVRAQVTDGRHRIEALRQLGFKQVPVSVDPSQAQSVRRKFGAERTPFRPRPRPPGEGAFKTTDLGGLRRLLRRPLRQAELGVDFVRQPSAEKDGDAVVIVDVDKLYESLRKNSSFFVGPGGTGDLGRVPGFKQFLDRAAVEGINVEMSRAAMVEGEADIFNGRHRIEALRQLGFRQVPVSVDPRDAAEFARKFGAERTPFVPIAE